MVWNSAELDHELGFEGEEGDADKANDKAKPVPLKAHPSHFEPPSRANESLPA